MFKTITIATISILFLSNFAIAKVFQTKNKALELSFPNATEIEKRQIFLSTDQITEAEQLAKTRINSKLYIFYVAKKGEDEIGYAVIDTHKLRTSTETVLFVIEPNGKLKKAEILAFFEPQDYMQGGKWVNLFLDKDLTDSLVVGKDVPNITGATITSHSFAEATRKVLAIYDIAVKSSENYTKKD